MRPTPYVASLRVYQPLEAFPPGQRERWLALRQQAGDSVLAEQRLALQRAVRPTRMAWDGAHFIDGSVDLELPVGQIFVCPWTTSVRCWGAVESFKESLPAAVSRLFLPPEIEHLFPAPTGDEVPSILSETWVIPPRWFALFTEAERESGAIQGQRWIRCRTPLANARKRAARTLQIVRQAFGDGPIAAENEELARWLEEFHPHSIIELDYGGLAALVEEPDTSITDVADSLAGLARGDGIEAGIGYQRLMARWRKVALFEHAT